MSWQDDFLNNMPYTAIFLVIRHTFLHSALLPQCIVCLILCFSFSEGIFLFLQHLFLGVLYALFHAFLSLRAYFSFLSAYSSAYCMYSRMKLQKAAPTADFVRTWFRSQPSLIDEVDSNWLGWCNLELHVQDCMPHFKHFFQNTDNDIHFYSSYLCFFAVFLWILHSNTDK